jgi:hypothetical protein
MSTDAPQDALDIPSYPTVVVAACVDEFLVWSSRSGFLPSHQLLLPRRFRKHSPA